MCHLSPKFLFWNNCSKKTRRNQLTTFTRKLAVETVVVATISKVRMSQMHQTGFWNATFTEQTHTITNSFSELKE